MSEHQCVAFRAIDGPVSEKNLEYMHGQSSRAEITPRSFDNEYHFGDFRGNAAEMLRRGYDLHLHYANFGIRKLMIRLPHGLPDFEAAKACLDDESLKFLQDKEGPGGILSVSPSHESGELDEIWEFDALVDRLIPLRAEILDGDLRPLYLMNLAIATDGGHAPEETTEAPVPAGLDKLTDAQRALAELYELGDSLIAAAAQGAPALSSTNDPRSQYADWLRGQPPAAKDAWLAKWMTDPDSIARREIMEAFQKSQGASHWPTIRKDRTIAELMASAKTIHEESSRKAEAAAAQKRAKKLADMAVDPAKTLQETEKLVRQRSTDAYGQIAALLADLREALAGSKQSDLAEQQARKLKKENPTLNKLTSELRRKGFLGK